MTKQMIVGTAAIALPGTVAGVFLAATPTILRASEGCFYENLYYSPGACIEAPCSLHNQSCGTDGSWKCGCS